MKSIGIIPARYHSSRFPGKPLALIAGKPMILWVYERAKKATQLTDLIVATDDEKIFTTVSMAGGKALMTSPSHETGTERVYEAASLYISPQDIENTIVINIQGDEPLIDPELINHIISAFKDPSIQIVTPIRKVFKKISEHCPHEVKVVKNLNNKILYFSRSNIPFCRDAENTLLFPFYIHIGIYAYRFTVLEKIVKLPPTELEKTEKLEQLRWLEHGYEIYAIETNYESHAVDTPEDIKIIHQLIASNQ
ncbi:MAG: 3-deoxy-manno-octulosonate cytidylyltransferase [Bacteroidales bacterium]|nr:3-deoxy-manno-octulosonate cytidylyltransferase [Bacteroidales bacterium]